MSVDAPSSQGLLRTDVESELTFAGFLVLSCPLKPDSLSAVTLLRDAAQRVVMITGRDDVCLFAWL
jgi:magnesium-transporting ATPase (P-type)